jgi:hypothetical protein
MSKKTTGNKEREREEWKLRGREEEWVDGCTLRIKGGRGRR